jgi:hypothetical protein
VHHSLNLQGERVKRVVYVGGRANPPHNRKIQVARELARGGVLAVRGYNFILRVDRNGRELRDFQRFHTGF